MKGGALQTPPQLFCILPQRSGEVMLQTEATAVWARKGSRASTGGILPGKNRRAAATSALMSFSEESDVHV